MLLRLNNDLVLLDNKKGLKSLSIEIKRCSIDVKSILTIETLSVLLNKKISRTNTSLSREINNYREYKKYEKINPLLYTSSWESLNKRQLLSVDLNVQDELTYFVEKEVDSKIVLIGNKVDMLTLYVKYNTIRKKGIKCKVKKWVDWRLLST